MLISGKLIANVSFLESDPLDSWDVEEEAVTTPEDEVNLHIYCWMLQLFNIVSFSSVGS